MRKGGGLGLGSCGAEKEKHRRSGAEAARLCLPKRYERSYDSFTSFPVICSGFIAKSKVAAPECSISCLI